MVSVTQIGVPNVCFQCMVNCMCWNIKYNYRLVNNLIVYRMQGLAEVQLQNTVTVKVQCQLNEQVVVKNFKLIMDCLTELNNNHNDLSAKFNKASDRLAALEKYNKDHEGADYHTTGGSANNNTNTNNNKNQSMGQAKQEKESASKHQVSATGDNAGGVGGLDGKDGGGDGGALTAQQKQNLLKMIKQLTGRTSQNQKNIMDNIKDINLINKEITDIKDQLSKLKDLSDRSTNSNGNANNTGNDGRGKGNASMDNILSINKELQGNKELMIKYNDELDNLRNELADLKARMAQIVDDASKNLKSGEETNQKSKNNANNNGGDISRAEFNELRQKISILNKKVNGLQLSNDELKQQTNALGQGQSALEGTCEGLNKQIENLKQKLSQLLKNWDGSNNSNSKNTNNAGSNRDADDLRLLKRQVKDLRSQIEQLKRDKDNNSKTSIEGDQKRNRLDKAAYTHARFKDDDRLKDLIARIQYLQRMMGSKNSITDKSEGQDKLPLIKRAKLRDRDSSIHDKSVSKKDINDIKAQLQAWLNNYMADMKSKDNFEDIELKIQELRNNLNKKADQEGMRKGLSFLQSKINQLYLFLTEPDGEDAMIVRKGFNCLSCSKKVEKLRGKIGPNINWNNMTATNYSPPKVGYSRRMAEGSTQKDDDGRN